jgi:hypothetical protein
MVKQAIAFSPLNPYLNARPALAGGYVLVSKLIYNQSKN